MTARRAKKLSGARALRLAGVLWAATVAPALAFTVELKDAGPDRVERQRAAAEGRLPLPDTPNTAQFTERLARKGLTLGSDIFIRIFKAQSQLEVWMEKDGTYVLFDTYPICHWSGGLGPKLRQGDKQAPEGFYSLTRRNLHRAGRWPNALNLGYPNAFDRAQSRSGSYILVHGGCSSVGCFAMTNPVMTEIYALATAAFNTRQHHIPVHVFPFRMTDEGFGRYQNNEWISFWRNLKDGYELFEETRRPPKVGVCQNRYTFAVSTPLDRHGPGPIGLCGETLALVDGLDRLQSLLTPVEQARLWTGIAAGAGLPAAGVASGLRAIGALNGSDLVATADFNTRRRGQATARSYACNSALPTCRRYMALQERRFVKRAWAAANSNRGKKSSALKSRQGRI